MTPTMLRILIAVVLIAHGYIHLSLTYVPVPKPGQIRTPFWPAWWRTDTDPAWLASKLGLSNNMVRGLGSALWLLTLAGFTLAGLGLLGVPGLKLFWEASAVLGSLASLLLLVFYWHPWLPVGVILDLAVLAGVWFHFPKYLFG